MTPSLVTRLSRLRICVYCEHGPDSSALVLHLQRGRGSVRHCWPMPDKLSSDADLLVCDFTENLAMRLPWTPGDATAALLAVLPGHGRYSLPRLQGACPDAVLHRPAVPHAVDTAVMMALDHFNYIRRLRLRIDHVEETVRSIRTIEKAKQILMSLHGIDEEKAFHMLRDMAMRKRVTISALAGGLVDSDGLLTYKQ